MTATRRHVAPNAFRKLSIRSRGTPASVAQVRARIVEFARASGFTDDQVFEIGLAVGEACANAVMHALLAESWFRVDAIDKADKLVVKVSDPGENPAPALQRDPDRVGGLGLFLIRRLMDRVSLEMSPAGTKLTMSRQKRAA